MADFNIDLNNSWMNASIYSREVPAMNQVQVHILIF